LDSERITFIKFMKFCPTCRTNYSDNNLQFCLQDGTQLVADEPETVMRNPMRIDVNQPQSQAGFQPPQTGFQVQPQPEPTKSNTGLIILGTAFVTFLLLGVLGIGAWFLFSKQATEIVQNTNTNTNANSISASANSNANTNANAANIAVNGNVNAATPTPAPKVTLKPAEVSAIKKEVEGAITSWKEAAEGFDLDGNVNSYADTVDYYKGGKIPRSKVKSNKAPAYSTYDTINVTITNMKVTPDSSGEKVTAVFDKEWDFANDAKVNRGQVQQQLTFIKSNGKWKISSEKDLKVYWVDKGANNDEGDY
jgi:hypothetical protein